MNIIVEGAEIIGTDQELTVDKLMWFESTELPCLKR